MSKLFEEIAKGTAEARAYMGRKAKGYKVTLPETVDVRRSASTCVLARNVLPRVSGCQ